MTNFTLTDAGDLLKAIDLLRSISMGNNMHTTMQFLLITQPDGSVLFTLSALEGKAPVDESETPAHKFHVSSYGNNAEFLKKLGELAEKLSEDQLFQRYGKEPFPGTDRQDREGHVAFMADGAPAA